MWLASSFSNMAESVFDGACNLRRGLRDVSVRAKRSTDRRHAYALAKIKEKIPDCQAARGLRRALYTEWYEYNFGADGGDSKRLEHNLLTIKNKWIEMRATCREEYQQQVYAELLRRLRKLSGCLGASKCLYQLVNNAAAENDDKKLWALMVPFLKAGARSDIVYNHIEAKRRCTFDVLAERSELAHMLDAFYANKKIGRSGMVLSKSDPEDDDEQERQEEDGSFEIHGFVGISQVNGSEVGDENEGKE